MSEETNQEQPIGLVPINKDVDLLSGFEVRQLKPSAVNFLETQVSTDEAWDKTSKNILSNEEDSQGAGSLSARWTRFKNYCLTSFQTNASDFAHTDVPIVFSKRVRDRLAELAVTSDEAQMITLMQQNEERLRVEIKKQSAELERLHKDSMHWEMIELISNACQLLINTKSPQFYPAQFMMVLDLVDCFGRMVFDRISKHSSSNGDFLTKVEGTRELLALNWSMILCRTSKLLPRLLLQIAFLRCVKFHPFKTIQQAIDQIISAIPGLGTASSGIYTRSYLLYTVYTYFPETSCDIILPLFTSYTRSLIHIKDKGFKRQFNIIDYSFTKYIETHRPALRFVLSVMVSVGDTNFLKNALSEFYEIGTPSSFILSALLEELPPKFVSKIYNVLLNLIDKSDSVIPHSELINNLVTTLCSASLAEGIMDLMNNIWDRMRQFKSVEEFVYVAQPMAKFIAKFCSPYYLNLFLANVVNLLRENFAGRNDNSMVPRTQDKRTTAANQKKGQQNAAQKKAAAPKPTQNKELSKKLADCVSACIITAVETGQNFADVLQHIGSIVDLMDFLNEDSLVNISRFILNNISQKTFELTDPLCIRILLELSQMLHQSLSVLSAVDVIEKTNATIEWFLYRVDFGTNVDAHLSFLISARQSFPTSSTLLSCIARIAIRLAANVSARQPPMCEVILRSLFAFVFVTIPSINDVNERAALQLHSAQSALSCDVVCFAHSFYDEFVDTTKLLKPNEYFYSLLVKALNLLLLMPTKPDVKDPYQQIREIIISSVRINWQEDEAIRFSLESLILMSHSLRSEYHFRVRNVNSNDILFAGNEEFRARGTTLANKMLPRFLTALTKYNQKGIMAQKTKVPTLALRAMVNLPDLYELNDFLLTKLKELANLSMQGDSKQIKELRSSTIHHLNHTMAASEKGMAFLKVFASADAE